MHFFKHRLNGYDLIIDLDRLDSFIDNIVPPVLLKIDVEGHEKEVFEGCKEVLKRYKPILLWESKHGNITEILEFLKGYDYDFYTVEGNKLNICDMRTILNQDMIVSI